MAVVNGSTAYVVDTDRNLSALPDERVAIADSAINRVRIVGTDSKVSTVAGNR